jgi:hypothetical protein
MFHVEHRRGEGRGKKVDRYAEIFQINHPVRYAPGLLNRGGQLWTLRAAWLLTALCLLLTSKNDAKRKTYVPRGTFFKNLSKIENSAGM